MWGLRLQRPALDEVSPASTFTGLTIKAALITGFGLMFGIWLFAGYYLARQMAVDDARATTLNNRFMQAQELLSTVRAQVLLGSVYVRDALLDPDPTTADGYRQQMEKTYHAADQALAQYVPVLDSSPEREQIARLRQEIDEFRRTMLQVLETDTSRWPTEARTLLRTQIVPKREVVIQVSEQVQALNRSAFVEQQARTADAHADTHRWLWGGLGLALVTSFGIGLVATVYASRLEDRIRQRRLKDGQNARELQRLSAKLIRAQEEERRTIARELHDEVGQVLTTIKVELALAQKAIKADGGAAHLLDDARSIADGALSTIRDLSHSLHPALLDDLGLPSAIEWYLRSFGKRHHIRTEALCDRLDERLAPETETSAYRIVQEALTNVANHAHATTCRVYLQRLPAAVLITIEDDGAGCDAAALELAGGWRGLGLIGIRERVSELGGTLRIETAPGKGMRLAVELPAGPRLVADEGVPDKIDDLPGDAIPLRAFDG